MKKPAPSSSWLLNIALIAVIVLTLLLLLQTGVVPGSAALQSLMPQAITNPQKAAILGGQNLLAFPQSLPAVYLPILTR